MPWLRIDDGFTEHRKLVALQRKDRWTWMEVLTYCARQGNGGHVPEGISDVLRWATPAFLERCADIGLLDREAIGYAIHDWMIYNAGTIEERVYAYLQGSPDASANDVHRAIGGKREIVLAVVKQYLETVPGNQNGNQK